MTNQLSQLTALTFTILCEGVSWGTAPFGNVWSTPGNIRQVIKILACIERASLRDVRVVFAPEQVASLGCPLSKDHGGHATAVCRELEEALLSFSSSRLRILFTYPLTVRRAGRVELWSSHIKRCFPRLDGGGMLTLPCSKQI